MPVASLLRQIQSLLSGSVFPSKLEAELRGKIDLNRHMDQLREQVAALEVQISSYNSRRAELVAAKWERVSMGVLAESREAFSRSAHRDIVSYVKSLHGMVRALKQDAALGSGLHAGASVQARARSPLLDHFWSTYTCFSAEPEGPPRTRGWSGGRALRRVETRS